jgi:cytoskeletal protein CcmA (bactofilin family)
MAKQQIRRKSRVDNETVLGSETVLKGTLRFSHSLTIRGVFEGEIEASGHLVVENGSNVRADIKVASAAVSGSITGNILAEEKLEMNCRGQVFGNVRTRRLRIADGVLFEGAIEMIKDPKGVDVFSTRGEKLKQTVTSV